MKLRSKTLIIVASTLLVLEGVLYTVSRSVLMDGFTRVEVESTVRNVQRVLDAFSENISNLSIKAADWAKWDDTYEFIDNVNQVYVKSNLTDESLLELKINIMLFLNKDKRVIFGRGYDLEAEEGKEIDPRSLSTILSDEQLMNHEGQESVFAGIIMLPEGPMSIVSRPILTSEGQGPVRGTIIFGRYLDDAEVNRFAQITHLELQVMEFDSESLTPDLKRIRDGLSEQTSILVEPLNENSIAGYTFLKDIHNNPVLLVKIDVPRDIYKQGLRTRLYLVVAIFFAGLIFGFTIILLLEKMVLSKVAKLNSDVTSIGISNDRSLRVQIKGKDELAGLAGSINGMLEALQESEQEILNKNREMRLIMNTVQSGLLSFNEHYIVNPEYSKSVKLILGQNEIAGRSYFDLIGISENRIGDRQKFYDFFEVLRQEIFPEKDLAVLNPFEELCIQTEKGIGWIRIRYHLIDRGQELSKHILAVLEDITEEKALAEKVKRSERENMQLKAIAEDPDLFRDFLIEMRQILNHAEENLRELDCNSQCKAIVNEIFRDVHTIKGTSGSFGLASITEIAGVLEDNLSILRESGEITAEVVNRTRESLGRLSCAMLEVVEGARKILGDEIGDSADMLIRISLEKLKRQLSIIKELLFRELLDEHTSMRLSQQIESEFKKLRMVPARKGLAKALKIIAGLRKRVQKDVRFIFEGEDVPIDCEVARELNTPLVHLLRNSFDHGIESEDERQIAGKEHQGTVKVEVKNDGSRVLVQVSDDGRGLDPAVLKSAAVRKGLISEQEASELSVEESFALIFRPGFSTSHSVTDVSGRGVGMDAVVSSVQEKLKGELLISSETGIGTKFTLSIPTDICG